MCIRDRLRLSGDGHAAFQLDVTDLSSVEAAWQEIINNFGCPDIVIYNAGTYEPMSSTQFDFIKAEQMVDVNFRGILRILKFVLPKFVKNNSGHIVLVGSVAGYSGLPNAIGYGASKAAVIHLAENLQADLYSTDIKIQIVNPGFVKTRLTDRNSFKMPFIITAEEAAKNILEGMQSKKFAIDFPKKFTLILKFLRILPYSIYFKLLKIIS